MGKQADLTGRRFGRLVAIRDIGAEKNRTHVWICECDCGAVRSVRANHLRSGASRSCGCMQREIATKQATKHGGQCSRLYRIWKELRRRCRNPGRHNYKFYGGRGISVCPEWDDFSAFRNWALSAGYADHLEIDRIDNDGDYEPSNCRWSTRRQQNNNRRDNRLIEFRGRTKTVAQWAREAGLKYDTLWGRLKRGWPIEKALSEPCP